MSLVLGITIASCGGDGGENNDGAHAEPTHQTQNTQPQGETSEEATNPFGVGPIQEKMDLPAEIDEQLAAKGEEIFQAKCTACHKIDEKYIGPAMKGVTERRSPEWIMNMILAPEKMIQEDPVAKQLVMESNGAIMANQGLTEEEARAVLEYFRKIDSQS
ncbi:MAG: cytochrome c [Chlorobi bacterium]|nr:cytochrome c [Chlorobiota bacterium]